MLAEGVLKVKIFYIIIIILYIKVFGIGNGTINMMSDFQCKLLYDGCLHSNYKNSVEDV